MQKSTSRVKGRYGFVITKKNRLRESVLLCYNEEEDEVRLNKFSEDNRRLACQ